MSPLKKRVMSSTKITPWQEVKSNCRDGTGVSLRRRARHPRGAQLGSVLARRRRPAQQAAASCSPLEAGIHLPGDLPRPCSPLSPLPSRGPKLGASRPIGLALPTSPRADLSLEAKDGDREADEGRDTQAQQHRCGVVVAADAGPASGRPSGLPGPPPGPPSSARPDPLTSGPPLSPLPGVLPPSAFPASSLGPALPNTLRFKLPLEGS